MSRIIAGEFGGRRLRVPAQGTRPTSDRAREALFSRLEHLGALDGARVLDLYAGSGALGLEALSRGAREVVMVESARPAAAVCHANARTLGVADRVQVITVPVERYLGRSAPAAGFDLVLADPPYDVVDLDGVLEALARDWLAARAVVVLERGARAADVDWPPPLTPMDVRRYGDSVLWFADTGSD
ncbi:MULTISPECIES: 16S rRNA (guanine(966)-N(2))-methyltransferase RsmD [unclassified Pseudactinotalea]|uniref:16S rRNA (guanine(966)-N(2))-methyltransferase RsmD n=1 Tax=Micrococcales TaxID=85006 RepID=UPI003C7A3038